MNYILIVIYVMLIYVAIAFWEAYVEGRNAWDRRKYGWKINFKTSFLSRPLTAYHFWSWLVMIPMFLMLPLVIFGWDKSLFWLLVSCWFLGAVLEDFLWFVFNPEVSIKEFNERDADWHYWIGFGKYKLPEFYILWPIVVVLIWIFLV